MGTYDNGKVICPNCSEHCDECENAGYCYYCETDYVLDETNWVCIESALQMPCPISNCETCVESHCEKCVDNR
jgi:hypothetical protein